MHDFEHTHPPPLPISDSNSMVNHALFVTAFLRSMPLGVKARKGYELLVAGGRTPGAVKGIELKQVSTRVANWREAALILDSGLASVLQVPQARLDPRRTR